VTILIDTCNRREVGGQHLTHSQVWHDSFIYVTWIIHICDMTHLCVTGEQLEGSLFDERCAVATGEWVMSHIWVNHVNESCHIHEWFMWMSHVTHMSHIWMSHVTPMMNHAFLTSAPRSPQVHTKTNESCHAYEWVMLFGEARGVNTSSGSYGVTFVCLTVPKISAIYCVASH